MEGMTEWVDERKGHDLPGYDGEWTSKRGNDLAEMTEKADERKRRRDWRKKVDEAC